MLYLFSLYMCILKRKTNRKRVKMVYSVEVLAEGFYTITDGFKLKGVHFI